MLVLMLGVFVLSLLAVVFWIWMLIDCATKEPSEGNEKIVWILIIVFLQAIGALIYFFVRRPTRIREARARGLL
jgi:hypothetical protein